MGQWQVDLGRLLAAIVEAHHDDYGIIWPRAVSPVDVHIVALDTRKPGVAEQAEALYIQLLQAGLRVLLDDRDASAGVKFNDSDLIGAPFRLTVSKRSVKDGLIEAKWRNSRDKHKLNDAELDAIIQEIKNT